MSTFTMRLAEVLEQTPDIGLDDFPIFDEAYRPQLVDKIQNHYYLQEIAFETVHIFRFAMRRKMNEIMPMYNQLYKSTQIEFDPMMTIDIRALSETKGNAESVTAAKGKASETSEADTLSESKSAAVASTFPQNRLAGNKDYASSGQDNVSASTGKTTTTGSNTTEQDESNTAQQDGTSDSHTTGFQGNRAALLMDYRATFLNVDMLVISELDELFMQVWSNGDSYTGGISYARYPFA